MCTTVNINCIMLLRAKRTHLITCTHTHKHTHSHSFCEREQQHISNNRHRPYGEEGKQRMFRKNHFSIHKIRASHKHLATTDKCYMVYALCVHMGCGIKFSVGLILRMRGPQKKIPININMRAKCLCLCFNMFHKHCINEKRRAYTVHTHMVRQKKEAHTDG